MSLIKKNYSVTKTKQLIDLNGETVNFKLTFDIKSKNNEPYQVVVVNENNLQSEDDFKFEYKLVNNGIISGEIVADSDVYQNYYLLIKSDNPCECEVTLKIEDILPKPQPPPQQEMPMYQPMQQMPQYPQHTPPPHSYKQQIENFELPKNDTGNIQSSSSSLNPLGSFNFKWKYIGYAIIFVIILAGLYFYFYKNPKDKESQPQPQPQPQPQQLNYDEFKGQLPLIAPQTSCKSTRESTRESSRASSRVVSPVPVKLSDNSGLLAKLNKLKVEKNDL